jgi:phosphoadenosine phosphosulfate reductase
MFATLLVSSGEENAFINFRLFSVGSLGKKQPYHTITQPQLNLSHSRFNLARYHIASKYNTIELHVAAARRGEERLTILTHPTRKRTSKEKMMQTLQQKANDLNSVLDGLPTAQERLQYVFDALDEDGKAVLTTSFGIQSSLMLHLVTTAAKQSSARDVPVVWIDTGYLPKETYYFAEELTSKLNLDLRVYQSSISPARMEALHGKLWEDPSNEAHKKYNYIRKVEPMKRALQELGATVVFSGVLAGQTSHRQEMKMVHVHDGRLKICPILDWTKSQVSDFFQEQGLPYHPLQEKGYKSVGDWHSSAPFDPKIHKNERDTRFHGRTQECGLHIASPEPDDEKLMSWTMMKKWPSSVSTSSMVTSHGDNDGFLLYTKPSCRFCLAAKALIQHLQNEELAMQNKGVAPSTQERGVKMVSSDDDSSSSSVTSVTWEESTSSSFAITEEVQVGEDISPVELQQALGRPVKTVPQILHKGNYIGGYEDLVTWIKSTFPHVNLPDTVQLAEKFCQE